MKTGESGLTVFRLLTKDNLWKWVQANARLVYKNGKPDYIIATQRPLMYVHSPGPCHCLGTVVFLVRSPGQKILSPHRRRDTVMTQL